MREFAWRLKNLRQEENLSFEKLSKLTGLSSSVLCNYEKGKNDVTGVYPDNEGKTPIVGIDARFDEPQHPDLVLEVDKLSEEETFQAVLDYMEKKYGKGWEKEVRA